MENRNSKLGAMPMGNLLISMSIPLMISMLVQALYNIVDAIYVARLSETALTATTLAFPMQMLMMAFAVGTGVGVNSLASRSLGEGDLKRAKTVAANGYMLAVASAALFALIGIFLTKPFVSLFTEDSELITLTDDYLSICLTYSLGVYIATMGERLLQATGKASFSMITQATGAVTNIILDPILIFGRYGCPALGIRGAAIATVIGQWVSMLLSVLLNLLHNPELRVTRSSFRLDFGIIRGIYAVGLPAIVMQAIGSFMNVCMNRILIVFSTTAVAVFGIYFKLNSFVFMPVFGLTQGLVPIIGFNYGARNPERVKRAFRLATIAAVAVMLFGTVMFELIPDRLILLFDDGEELMRIGVRALRIIGVFFPFAAVSIVRSNVLQGMGDGIFSLLCSILRNLLLLLPSAFLFAKYLGLDFVWFGFWVSEMGSLAIMDFMFRRKYRSKLAGISSDGEPL